MALGALAVLMIFLKEIVPAVDISLVLVWQLQNLEGCGFLGIMRTTPLWSYPRGAVNVVGTFLIEGVEDSSEQKDKMESKEGESMAMEGDSRVSEAAAEPASPALQEPAPPTAGKSKPNEPEVSAMSAKAKRREKRLKHEPQNVTGEWSAERFYNLHLM